MYYQGQTHHANETLVKLSSHFGLEFADPSAQSLDNRSVRGVPPRRVDSTLLGLDVPVPRRRGRARRGWRIGRSGRSRLGFDLDLGAVRLVGRRVRRQRGVRRYHSFPKSLAFLLLPRCALAAGRYDVRLGVLRRAELCGVVAVDHEIDVLVLLVAAGSAAKATAAVTRRCQSDG